MRYSFIAIVCYSIIAIMQYCVIAITAYCNSLCRPLPLTPYTYLIIFALKNNSS